MEKIKQRSMKTFVSASLLSFVAGFLLAFLVVGIGVLIFAPIFIGIVAAIAVGFGLVVALFATNLYRIYFYYKLSMDINALCEGDGKESESYLIAAALSSLTLGLYQIYWAYKLAQRLRVNAPRYGFKMLETGKDIAILDAFSNGFIAAWELIKNTNKAAKVFNEGGM